MSKNMQYLKYIARHKYFVFLSGLKTKAPLWRLLIHNWTKLLPSEWAAYREHFYGVNDDQAFRTAWLRHIHRNSHHWEYWCKFHYGDGGAHITLTPYPMPDLLIREMVADWLGAGRAAEGQYRACRWYLENKYKKLLHPKTRAKVEFLLDEVAKPLEGTL